MAAVQAGCLFKTQPGRFAAAELGMAKGQKQ
jgi:hypothetical protein